MSASNPTVDEELRQFLMSDELFKLWKLADMPTTQVTFGTQVFELITRERTAAYNRGREVEKSMVPVHRKAAQTELLDELAKEKEVFYIADEPFDAVLLSSIQAYRTKLTGEDKDNE